jgi:hypothetical protein
MKLNKGLTKLLIKLQKVSQTSISSQQDWIHLQPFLLTCQDVDSSRMLQSSDKII